MCVVLPRISWQGGSLRAPVASPQPLALTGIKPDQHQMGDFALPNPSTKGRACPLEPSRLQRGEGAFCAPLDPMTISWRPTLRGLDVRQRFAVGYDQGVCRPWTLHRGRACPLNPSLRPRGQPYVGWMPVWGVAHQIGPILGFSVVYPLVTLPAMSGKDSGLRVRVEKALRDEFLEACHAQDRPAAQVIREFMRNYVAQAGAGNRSKGLKK